VIGGGARIYHLTEATVGAAVIDDTPQVPWKKRLKAFFFVLAGFAFWYLFAALAKFVMRCEVTDWWWPVQYRCAAPQSSWSEPVMLVTTLAVAIWAARRLVFPPDD
jgi:hypothetical protein